MKDSLKTYLILLVVGIVLSLSVAYANRDMGYHVIHLLCDGFFVSGVLLGGSGVIGFAGTKGTFDMMGYGIKVTANAAFSWIFPPDSDFGKKESFMEYKERKDSNRKNPVPMMLSGATLLAVALVLYVLYLLIA